jgi:hypothetical protein
MLVETRKPLATLRLEHQGVQGLLAMSRGRRRGERGVGRYLETDPMLVDFLPTDEVGTPG